MKNENKETVLTVAEMIKMGEVLSDVRAVIELYNRSINLTPDIMSIEESEIPTHYNSLYDLVDSIFHLNQKLMIELDDISYLLQTNNEAKEIENVRKKFN